MRGPCGAFDWGPGCLLSIYGKDEVSGEWGARSCVCVLLCNCFGASSPSFGLRFPQNSNSGWSHQPRLSTLCWKSGCGWYRQKGASFMFEINFLSTVSGTCDNSLPPAALHIRELVINEMGSRGQLRWPHRGPRAAQESPPLPRLANVPVCGHS